MKAFSRLTILCVLLASMAGCEFFRFGRVEKSSSVAPPASKASPHGTSGLSPELSAWLAEFFELVNSLNSEGLRNKVSPNYNDGQTMGEFLRRLHGDGKTFSLFNLNAFNFFAQEAEGVTRVSYEWNLRANTKSGDELTETGQSEMYLSRKDGGFQLLNSRGDRSYALTQADQATLELSNVTVNGTPQASYRAYLGRQQAAGGAGAGGGGSLALQVTCTLDAQCASGHCSNNPGAGKCCNLPGGACVTAADCCTPPPAELNPGTCVVGIGGGICCAVVGEACSSDAECCSGAAGACGGVFCLF